MQIVAHGVQSLVFTSDGYQIPCNTVVLLGMRCFMIGRLFLSSNNARVARWRPLEQTLPLHLRMEQLPVMTSHPGVILQLIFYHSEASPISIQAGTRVIMSAG